MGDSDWIVRAVVLVLFAGALVLMTTGGGSWPPYGSGPRDSEEDDDVE